MRGVRGLISVLAISATAHGQKSAGEETDVYSLSYVRGEGADSCPPRTELAREVSARLGRAAFDEAAPRSIEIHVQKLGSGYEGLIHLRDAQGRVLGRRALSQEEPDCQALFSATALAVALLIDPEAASREPQPALPSRAPEEPPPPTPVVVPLTTAAGAAEPIVRDQLPPRPPAQPSRDHPGFIVVEAVGATGLVPEAAAGFGLYGGGRPHRRFGFSLSAMALPSSKVSADGATFGVGLTAFGLSGSFELLPEGSSRLALEVGPLVGALHTTVEDPTPRDTGDFWFAAVSAGLRAQVAITPAFFLSLRAAVLVPLVRRGLFVEGAADPVWRQPAVAGLGAAGLGLSFF